MTKYILWILLSIGMVSEHNPPQPTIQGCTSLGPNGELPKEIVCTWSDGRKEVYQ